jgi:glycosyltransferase involved in cell wall biosynthesis
MTLSGRVSVVVPFLNAALFLREAIESVVAQTYGKWELLLVDDGSSDGSSQIAGEYAARFRRRVARLAHPDGGSRGPAAARNLALGAARGDFIAFLDADDVWSPQKLERQTSIMATHPHVGMLYGTSRWWYSWAGEEEDGRRDRVEPLGVPAWVAFPPRSLLRPYFVLQHAAIPNPTSILLRRSVIETVGGFDESVPDGHEDQALYAKVCVHTTSRG